MSAPGPGALLRQARALRASSDALRAVSREARVQAVAGAARALQDPTSAEGEALQAALVRSTGLSAEAVAWGLSTTLDAFEEEALLALLDERRGTPVALTVAILAGNVFSAAARPLLLPLACGAPVLAKTAGGDDTLARAVGRALGACDATVAASLGVASFGREERALEEALLAEAESVTVLGSDEAVAAIAGRAPAGAAVVGRGHGLGAIVVTREALAATDGVASAAALDVAAYDQRGCLSPHFVLVEGDAAAAERFAVALAAALEELERSMPRGVVPEVALAEQLQWRGVAAARGAIHDGGRFAVSEEGTTALRPSPGYRNVGVYRVADVDEARALLSPLGKHLKALGVTPPSARAELEGLAPFTCDVGSMQAPPLSAHLDGLHPLAGYFTHQ